MYCEKCQNLTRTEVKEKKCKSCNTKFRSRFANICYSCQVKGFCPKCGILVKKEN